MPSDHALRKVRVPVDGVVLCDLDRQVSEPYSTTGLLMEQLDYNLQLRWFAGLGVEDRVWDATEFTRNRDRLLNSDLAVPFLESVVVLVFRTFDQAGGEFFRTIDQGVKLVFQKL